MKLFAMLLLAVYGFFYTILSPFLPKQPERTDWMVDGVYRGFIYMNQVEEKTMNRLRELVEAGDGENLYLAFRDSTRNSVEDLDQQIQELIDFSQTITGWEADNNRYYSRNNGVITTTMDFTLTAEDGTAYLCAFRERVMDGQSKSDVGITAIYLYPEEVRKEYAGLSDPGIRIVYRLDGDDPRGREPMETLTALAAAGDAEGLDHLFSQEAQYVAGEPAERAPELFTFLTEEIDGWTPLVWTQKTDVHRGASRITQEVLLSLQGTVGEYRCRLRFVTEDACCPEMVGLYSVTIFPNLQEQEDYHENETYMTYSSYSWEEAGIFIARWGEE